MQHFKFKIESKVPFLPSSPAAQKTKLYSAIPQNIWSGWIRLQLGGIFARKEPNRLDIVQRDDFRFLLNTLQISGPRNELNIYDAD